MITGVALPLLATPRHRKALSGHLDREFDSEGILTDRHHPILMSSFQHHEHDVRCPIISVANPAAELHKSLPQPGAPPKSPGLKSRLAPSVGKGKPEWSRTAVRYVCW